MSDTPEEYTVTDCTRCPALVECRSQIVDGVGPMDADIVLVGEAPGKNEDENGEPFVGRSGDVLNEVLAEVGIDRDDIRITNCVRCRPPENRDPYVDELSNCRGYLEDELKQISPDVIVPLGRVPTNQIVSSDFGSVTEAAGSVFDTELGGDNSVVVVSVHPAATLYNRDLRPAFEETFEKIRSLSE